MCDPITLAVVGLTAAGSFGTAFMQSGIAKGEAQIQQQQLRVEIENERIKAMGDTNDRLEQFRKDEASNRAALSASGLDQNISYAEGILPANRRTAYRDIRNIRYNMQQQVGRKKYEIGVEGWKARATSRSGYVTAAAETASALGGRLLNREQSNAVYGQP